jgi:DNA-binding NarL/FixJ family response regulator
MKILSSLKNPNKREAFLLMAQGYEYSEIAKKINISETTIRNKYVGNMHKLLDRGVHL